VSESTTKTAIITAVLTGVFTVVAGIATYWLTTKEPELSFSVVGGPTLTGTTGTKRIFVVEVRNSGRKEITQTLVQLALQGGELSEVASEASPGVKLTEEKTQRQVDIRADSLNPGDFVKVSFLTSLASPYIEPKVVVRAPGVQAIAESGKRGGLFGKGTLSDLLVLLAGALGAVMSSFLLLSRSRISRKLGLPSPGSSIDQSEVGAFVCGACGLFEESDRLRFGGSEISYRGTADYLRHRALRAAPEERPKYNAALRALLLNQAISTTSFSTIRAAIDVVGTEKLSDTEFNQIRGQAIDEGDEPVVWREKVEAYVRTLLPGS
jgi:hypothetical protein